MKLQVVFFILFIGLLTSCGTKKSVVNSKPTPPVILDPVENETEVVQIEGTRPSIRKTKKPFVKLTQQYIEKFAPIAIRKMQEHKIPASITLAQGVLESGSGRSPLAIKSNNHFGIKCHKSWGGKSVTHDDDAIGECFRRYRYPEDSYEDHSLFLTSRKRYARLFKFKTTDYKNWAYGLKKAGYATDKRYPQKLIGIIKKYKLYKYDRMRSVDEAKLTGQSTKIYHTVQKGDTLYSIARLYGLSVNELKKKNGLADTIIKINQELIIK